MSILKEKVKSVNYPCDIDYVDDSKKSSKFAWAEHGVRRRRSESIRNIRMGHLKKKKHFWHALFCKMSFYISKKNIGKVYR